MNVAIGTSPISIGGGAGSGSMPEPSGLQPASAPVAGKLRAYFAPVQRASATPTFFDPAQASGFDPDNPPAPWQDLGWVENFKRTSASKVMPLRTGAPAATQSQVRTELEATVSLRFLGWGKLQLALAAGSEQMNLLATAAGAVSQAAGGTAATTARTIAGSSATTLALDPTTSANLQAGDIVAVDSDYTTQTGWVGSGVSAAFIGPGGVIGGSVDYIRRVTLNVARVVAVEGSPAQTLTLATTLPGGAPVAGTGVQQVVRFVDREGGSFFQEWSALFAAQGAQGDWIFYHYPRLQTMQGASESDTPLAGPLQWVHLNAQFRALPVTDVNDGAQVLCYRSYLPASNSAV